MSLTTQINNLKRKQVIMIYAGVVIVIGAIILYLVLQPSDTDKIKNTTPAAITQKTVSTTSYFSKLSIPSNLTVKENTQGNGTDFKTYSQTLTNSSGTFNIIITAIPTNIDKRQNTGLETFLVPDQSLWQSMVFLKSIDGNDLYRENSDIKYYYAKQESDRNQPSTFLTANNQISFPIYVKTTIPSQPFISTFKTTKNQEVQIIATIIFDVSQDDFNSDIKQLDEIIKSLQI